MENLDDALNHVARMARTTEGLDDYLEEILRRATGTAQLAMLDYPQPNYVLTKVAEEAGEVVKAGVHYAEGRDYAWEDLEDEVVQTIAMCLRLLVEGDRVHGVTPPWPHYR